MSNDVPAAIDIVIRPVYIRLHFITNNYWSLIRELHLSHNIVAIENGCLSEPVMQLDRRGKAMNTLISGQRNRLFTTLLLGLLMGMGILFSTSAMAQIAGTAHDFSDGLSGGGPGDTWNTTTEICVVCHTPHNSISPTEGPLWNRSTTTATFTMYTPNTTPGSDIDGTNFSDTPTGVSKLCLSCHDGSIALDSFGGATGSVFIGDVNADFNIGEVSGGTGDLSNDHPVAFTWPDTSSAGDPEIQPNAGGLVGGIMPLFGGGNDQLECASCHDVHGTGNPKLLRVNNTGSALCLTCHIK